MAKLHFFYGVMSSGKSTDLCSNAYELRKSNIPHEVLKSAKDNRDSSTEVVSKLGPRTPALVLDTLKGYTPKPNTKFILIDEVQFFTAKDIERLVEIAETTDITILCYGLKVDSDGELFEASAKLLSVADEFTVKERVCQLPKCGKTATHHIKFDENNNIVRKRNQIEIGDAQYKSVCRCHWYALYRGKTTLAKIYADANQKIK